MQYEYLSVSLHCAFTVYISVLLFSKHLKLKFHIYFHGWPFLWNATLVLCSAACPLWTETNVMLDPHDDPLLASAINSTCSQLLCPLWSTHRIHGCTVFVIIFYPVASGASVIQDSRFLFDVFGIRVDNVTFYHYSL